MRLRAPATSVAVFRLRRGNQLAISCCVGEALASDTLQGGVEAHRIAHAKLRAIAVAEVKFRKIAVQVLLAAMLIDAAHAALEDEEAALDGVREHVAAHLLSSGVIDDLMAGERLADGLVDFGLISDQTGFLGDVRLHNRLDVAADHLVEC